MVIGPLNGMLLLDDCSELSALSADVSSSSDLPPLTSNKPTGVTPVDCSMILVMKLGAYANPSTCIDDGVEQRAANRSPKLAARQCDPPPMFLLLYLRREEGRGGMFVLPNRVASEV